MRIAVAHFTAELAGGAEVYLHDLLPVLSSRGHRIALVHELTASPGGEPLDPSGIAEHVWTLAEMGPGALGRALQAWHPDVVYVNMTLDPALEGTLLDRFPCALYLHTYHGTCVSGTKMFSTPRPMPCDRRLGAACLALYLPRRCGGLNPLEMLRLFATQRRRLDYLGRYRSVLVASARMRRECVRHGVPDERVIVTPPCVRVDADPAPPTARPPGAHLLFVGRLTRLKGAATLVDAASIVHGRLGRPVRVTIIGDGPDRDAVARAARRSDAEVTLAGRRSRTQVRDAMRGADLLVMPSLWPEPFGLVGTEAGAVGLPAAAFAVGGIPDWLSPGVSGELAPADPPTPAGLADAIVRALGDPDHHQRLREGAWRQAVDLARQDHAAALEAVLDRVAGPSREETP